MHRINRFREIYSKERAPVVNLNSNNNSGYNKHTGIRRKMVWSNAGGASSFYKGFLTAAQL